MSLTAFTAITDDASSAALKGLAKDFPDYVVRSGTADGRWLFGTPWGRIAAERQDRGFQFRVEAEDEVNLCYVKMMVAGRVSDLPEGAIAWEGDGTRGTVPPFLRRMQVVDARNVTPHMRRLTLKGANLERFSHGGIHLRLLIPPVARAPKWPTLLANGLLQWPAGSDALIVRVYTIRSIDVAAGMLEIDIVVHAGEAGPGATYAMECVAGMEVGILGPLGSDAVTGSNVLFVADETALPAVANLLTRFKRGTRAVVLAEVESAADRYVLQSEADLDIRWVYREGRTSGNLPQVLADSVDAIGEDGYVWSAGEFMDFKDIRRTLRKDWRLPKDRHAAAAYWRRGATQDTALPDE